MRPRSEVDEGNVNTANESATLGLMAFVVRPGKYLIEKSRRRLIGLVAHVGTGGSVPKAAQAAIDEFVKSLAAGHRGADAKTIVSGEREAIQAGMKKMQGSWVILSAAGLRWILPDKLSVEDAIKKALKNSGWSVPVEQIRQLVG